MKTLKRDLPLTILIDFLVQVVFLVTILWAYDLGTLEAMNEGEKRLSYEELKKENLELRLEIQNLKRENIDLQLEITKLKVENKSLVDRIKDLELTAKKNQEVIREYEDKYGRKGKPDCFGSDLSGAPVIIFRWSTNENIEIKSGSNFNEAESKLTKIREILGNQNVNNLGQVLIGLSNYSDQNKCLVRVKFEAPAYQPPSLWLVSFDIIKRIKGLRVYTDYYK
jgi:hypothetical protein